MAYIRDRAEEKTGYQASSPLYGKIDFQCDFVMVYGTGPDMPERVRKYRENGYVVHLMTGIAWGGYQDYLFGRWDGRNHWDESQTDRFGNQILHGKDTPYMVPTISFAEFITERLKKAVDAGVEAIHVEEPEFWDRGGYSEAFKREYLLYYKTPWVAPHLSADAHYKCARLKPAYHRQSQCGCEGICVCTAWKTAAVLCADTQSAELYPVEDRQSRGFPDRSGRGGRIYRTDLDGDLPGKECL